MTLQEFTKILLTFADRPADLVVDHNKLIVEIRGELIEADLGRHLGDLQVTENGASFPAAEWIVDRIARLPILAERILALVPEEANFINPTGQLLDRVERSPEDNETPVSDATATVLELLGEMPAEISNGIYVTSDAGEGKTTLIHHIARYSAQKYRDKESPWLVVPVALGGRTFLRFDDVIIGTLVNTLRFPFLYYEAFVSLVKMGAIVPALDGFEEMFVENANGDAISALGKLMEMLGSSGTVLIAARNAYFDYKNLNTQTPLFESIRQQAVEFSRVTLKRWDRAQFVQYATRSGVPNGDSLFEEIAEALGDDEHPLLTRAVLVKRLMEFARSTTARGQVIERVRTAEDYFGEFVGSIIEREAVEKWIDKTGDFAQPLLTADEHQELLADIAVEMWINESASLRAEVLETIAELYAEFRSKDAGITTQIRQRVVQHALIVPANSGRASFRFDHEEFAHYFLGRGLERMLSKADAPDIRLTFRRSNFPDLAMDTAVKQLMRRGRQPTQVVGTLNRACQTEPHASFVRENAGNLAIRLIVANKGREPITVNRMAFSVDSLKGRELRGAEFRDCYFQRTDLAGSRIVDCTFERCQFEQLGVGDLLVAENAVFRDCEVASLIPPSVDATAVYVPHIIHGVLAEAGFSLQGAELGGAEDEEGGLWNPDDELVLMERICRAFLRSTGLNENTIRQRLGTHSSLFFSEVLPPLLTEQIVEEVPYTGAGQQHRYQLAVSLEEIQESIRAAEGSFGLFLGEIQRRRRAGGR